MFFHFKNCLTSEPEDFLHLSVTSSSCVIERVQHASQNPLHFKTISNIHYHKSRKPFIQGYLWRINHTENFNNFFFQKLKYFTVLGIPTYNDVDSKSESTEGI